MDNYLDMTDDDIDKLLLGCDVVNETETQEKEVCISCKSSNLVLDYDQHYYVCEDCGVVNNSFLNDNPLFSKEDTNGNNSASYGCPSNYFFPKSSLGTKISSRGYNKISILQRQGQMPYKEEIKKLGEGYKLVRVDAIKHNPPQVGLILTLSKLVRYAKNKNLKDILFIEDDLILHDHSKSIFETTYKNLPKNCDIFLGGSYWYQDMRKVKPGLVQVGDFSSLHFTILKDTAYDKILQAESDYKNNKLTYTNNIDRYLGQMSKEGKLNVYLSWPMFAKQEDDFSNMVNKETSYNSTSFINGNNLKFLNYFDK